MRFAGGQLDHQDEFQECSRIRLYSHEVEKLREGTCPDQSVGIEIVVTCMETREVDGIWRYLSA